MSSPATQSAIIPPGSRSDENRLASCLVLLNEVDEWISGPMFRLGLPKWFEFWYSIPACFFGTTFTSVAGPVWIALLALVWGQHDEKETCGAELEDNIFLLKIITFSVTVGYVVMWGLWQIGGHEYLAGIAFWNGNVYVLGVPFNIAVLAYILNGFPYSSYQGSETNCSAEYKKNIFSMAIYPLFLWPILITLLNWMKSTSKRSRPALKDIERKNAEGCGRGTSENWTQKKKFPAMTQLLAKYNGDASFPSGDVLCATMVALSIFNISSDVTHAYRPSHLASTIVILAGTGRMYVLAHHFFDVMVGAILPFLAHRVATKLGCGMFDMEWWHPLLVLGIFLVINSITRRKSDEKKSTKNPLAEKEA